MTNIEKLTARESVAINIMKAIAILSVIAAHVVSVSNINLFAKIVSSLWCLFARVGVVVFFVVGGFLYRRSVGDNKSFWKKKFFRIILPWAFCATLTYILAVIKGANFSLIEYLKWIFGSGTWYYYITIYTLFLFIFKWFYDKDVILFILIGIQIMTLTFASFGVSTTIPFEFLTDYLNPLHWIGYFSFGILIRKYRFDLIVRKKKYIVIALLVAVISMFVLYCKEIFTYFNIISVIFCISTLVVIAGFAYKIATINIAKHIGQIGIWSYCIYLLHMQIVQTFIPIVPDGMFNIIFSPFIGLGIMVALILIGVFVCNKFKFGEKIKMMVGL